MEEKQLMEGDEKEVAIIQFFRSLSNEQKETFCDFLITLKQFLNDEKMAYFIYRLCYNKDNKCITI